MSGDVVWEYNFAEKRFTRGHDQTGLLKNKDMKEKMLENPSAAISHSTRSAEIRSPAEISALRRLTSA